MYICLSNFWMPSTVPDGLPVSKSQVWTMVTHGDTYVLLLRTNKGFWNSNGIFKNRDNWAHHSFPIRTLSLQQKFIGHPEKELQGRRKGPQGCPCMFPEFCPGHSPAAASWFSRSDSPGSSRLGRPPSFGLLDCQPLPFSRRPSRCPHTRGTDASSTRKTLASSPDSSWGTQLCPIPHHQGQP